MADDDTFRQERKQTKIDPADIGEEQPSEVSATESKVSAPTLDDVLAIQKQAGVDIPEEVQIEGQIKGDVQPRPMEGIKVSGQMPPAMQAALQRRVDEVESPEQQKQVGQAGEPAPVLPPHQSGQKMQTGQIVTNDPNLNTLLGMVNTQNYETVSLPSAGRFYHDSDEPVTGEVNLRPMTGQEESILSTARFMRQGRGIEMIFRNCLMEPNLNPEKFLSVDRTFLLIYLRGISYGNVYEVTIKCPECGHQFDYEIDLNLPIDYCPDDFSETNLSGKLPKTGMTFTYRLMTGQDETDVSAYRERKTRFANSTDDTFLYRASILIGSIGKDGVVVDNRHGIHALLERLPVSDVNYIRNQINNPPFGVNTEVTVPCTACGAEFPVELPYEANFFFPRERTETEQ